MNTVQDIPIPTSDYANSKYEIIFMHDEGVILNVNQDGIDVFGYSNEEFINMDGLKKLVHPEDLMVASYKIKTKDELPYEIKFLKKDGSVFSAMVKGKNVKMDDNIIRITIVRCD